MFLNWQPRRVPGEQQRRWLTCPHETSSWIRPRLLVSIRKEDKVSKKLVWIPGCSFRVCCLDNLYARGIWWEDYQARIRYLERDDVDLLRRIRRQLPELKAELEKKIAPLTPQERRKFRSWSKCPRPITLDDILGTWCPPKAEKRTPQLPMGPVPRALYLLGLSPGVTSAEVRMAYRKKAFEHHPDRGGSVEMFKAINEAQSLLLELYNEP